MVLYCQGGSWRFFYGEGVLFVFEFMAFWALGGLLMMVLVLGVLFVLVIDLSRVLYCGS
jgi:hypothetical protein